MTPKTERERDLQESKNSTPWHFNSNLIRIILLRNWLTFWEFNGLIEIDFNAAPKLPINTAVF